MLVDRRRFSWAIFLICMAECLLWSMPVVSATYDVVGLSNDEYYRSHIAKDKDMFVYSDTVNQVEIDGDKLKAQIDVEERSELKEMVKYFTSLVKDFY